MDVSGFQLDLAPHMSSSLPLVTKVESRTTSLNLKLF